MHSKWRDTILRGGFCRLQNEGLKGLEEYVRKFFAKL